MEKSQIFFKSTYSWKKILISRYSMLIFIYKFGSVNSGWLIILIRSKVTQGDCFDFKMLLTIFNLQKQSFKQGTLLIFKRIVKCSTLFLRTKAYYRYKRIIFTKRNCIFSKKSILQIIRNSDSNKAHGMIWSAFVC